MKKICLKYISLPFVITVFICFLLEISVTQIPRSAIAENSRKSALFYQISGLHPQKSAYGIHTRKDYYADTVLLNLIYMQEKEHPLESVILVPYFDERSMDASENYMASVFSEPKANTYYSRYWHGSMVWLKPLLCVMDITGIFTLYTILTIGLCSFIVLWCARKKKWNVGISFLLAFMLAGGFETVSCLEYGNTMLMVLGMTVLFLINENRSKQELLRLCVIGGVITCFVDFLTIETLVFTLPMGMRMLMQPRPTEEQSDREQVAEIIQALLCWGFSYAGMFLCKWAAVSGIIGIQGIYDSLLRTEEHMAFQQGKALFYNVQTLLQTAVMPEIIQIVSVTGYGILLFYMVYLLWREKKQHYIVLVLIPYIRYVIVSNHSYLHYYFTYRAQMITLMFMTYIGIEKIRKKKSRGSKNVY